MTRNSNIYPINPETLGLAYGFLGVLGFSLTLPATRAAVADFDPTFVGLGRAVVAAVLAMIVLWATHQPLPHSKHWGSLLIITVGVVLGFPLLSAWAMQQLPATHGAVIIGLIPLATAIAVTVKGRERPSLKFWFASIFGSTTVVLFAFTSSTGQIQGADLVLLGAVIAAAIGYAEGGRLAHILGGWQVICWALVIAFPILLIPVTYTVFQHGLVASPTAWLGFSYVSIFSQFLAFFAWYHGMSIGGVARVSQIQLLQPFLTIVFSGLFLGEEITPLMLVVSGIVIASIVLGKQALIERSI
ncbi:DMT family transporter [Nostocaceae cyanobacterium CENA357]|uniref:DMT family transporter n=1 Tax=Atlanticothrix silvestris CENA357 TaxID=1725252 RepID=A0A8J7HFS4_9CYAN|nr:DMT family transporter [Atlanticothrix silvestris]MBH8551493.1 DMT family transporter [Atlanticothrix silvestris CENA357]